MTPATLSIHLHEDASDFSATDLAKINHPSGIGSSRLPTQIRKGFSSSWDGFVCMDLREASHIPASHTYISQSTTFHTILALLPCARNTRALITLFALALNFGINSSISFPGTCSHKLPRLFQSLEEKKKDDI